MKAKTSEYKITSWSPQQVIRETVPVPEEEPLCIYVNGRHLITIAATPRDQDVLVLGFLHYSGVLKSPDEIRALHFSQRDREAGETVIGSLCADVWLNHELESMPVPWMRTSGCGSGVVLGELRSPPAPLQHSIVVNPSQLFDIRNTLMTHAVLHRETRGVHSSGLFTPEGELLAMAEDIGRHNTLDKLLGLCLRDGINPDGNILFTTGRISSEMMSKAAWMRTPIVGSMTAPSSMAVALAEAWGITTAGYVRSGPIRVYTHPRRLLGETEVP